MTLILVILFFAVLYKVTLSTLDILIERKELDKGKPDAHLSEPLPPMTYPDHWKW